jgi:histidinol-phosphate aminotransferase
MIMESTKQQEASKQEKGGGTFEGIKLLLCENPLPPLQEAIAAAEAELPRSNYYTEPYSAPLRQLISERIGVPISSIHINGGSELILRQIFDRFGQRAHLLTPTYSLFTEIAERYLRNLQVPPDTTIVVIVNPNNPNGGTFDMEPLPALLQDHPNTWFLVDEAFIGMAGESVAHLVPQYSNLMVTRTLSKAHSLAGFRVGYAVLPETTAHELNTHNDAYPLARVSQAAAIATLQHESKIVERALQLRSWAEDLARSLRELGVRTYPSDTYFFLADFAPLDAADLSEKLKQRGVLLKPLDDSRLGKGFMRVTTALPKDNERVLQILRELL